MLSLKKMILQHPITPGHCDNKYICPETDSNHICHCSYIYFHHVCYYTNAAFCITGNSPFLAASHNTKPTFRFLQINIPRTVFVMDVSDSMNQMVGEVSKDIRVTSQCFNFEIKHSRFYESE